MNHSKFIKELFRNHSRSVVGRICKQNELIQKRTDLSCDQKLSILKDFNRELIYEESRNLENQFNAYCKGIKLEKYKIYDPTSK